MALPIEIPLFGFLLVVAVAIIRQRDLFAATLLASLFSLISAGVYTLLDAVDVAFTEAAVGAGISTVLVLATLALTGHREAANAPPKWGPLFVVVSLGVALGYSTLDMPRYGDASAVIHHHVVPRFIEESPKEIGIPNFVTSVLASYRGFDTFGELTVIFTAGIGVVLLLGLGAPDAAPRRSRSSTRPVRVNAPHPMAETPVLRSVTKALVPFLLLFALYVQFHGDFGPGGGFQAGVIFAAAFIVYGIVFGRDKLLAAAPPRFVELCIAFGLMLYGGTGIASLFREGNFLDYSRLDSHHPAHGQHLGIFLVELGVGISVAAVMLTIYMAFSGREKASS